MSSTLKQINNQLKNTLKKVYSNLEIQQLSFVVFEKVLGLTKTQCLTEPNYLVHDIHIQQINQTTERLLANEPIEYIFEEAIFFDFIFKVNPSVLIPRPETEELVDWINKENTIKHAKIMDIGTGSGCIAIALSKFMPHANVFAIDISKSALETAKTNNTLNNTQVSFIEHDILADKINSLPANFDIIVSNPPYVRESEKALMQNNVLKFEPHTALFVSDQNPLIFYEKIARLGTHLLNNNGNLYFEINEELAQGVVEILNQYPYNDIEIRKDINNKNRMVKAIFNQ